MSDAEHYQSHKDDPAEWGSPEPSRKASSRRLAAMVSVRFAPDEEQLVRNAARRAGDSLSGFVRRAALTAAMPSWTIAVIGTTRMTFAASASNTSSLGSVASHTGSTALAGIVVGR
jgi:hypothetical protein